MTSILDTSTFDVDRYPIRTVDTTTFRDKGKGKSKDISVCNRNHHTTMGNHMP